MSDFKQLLEEVQTKAGANAPLGKTLMFDFGDNQIFLDGTGEKNIITEESKEADCTVEISQDDFAGMMSGDLNPMNAFMSGKIKVKGDMGVAMKLQSVIG